MLKRLRLRHVGPAARMDIHLAPRLNLLTGDNGLGKTFALDVAWWALTRTWVAEPAWPSPDQDGTPKICFEIEGHRGKVENFESTYHFNTQSWSQPRSQPSLKGLVVYARADGGFSVWDRVRNAARPNVVQPTTAYHLDRDALWNGLGEGHQVVTNGLIRDWVNWQRAGNEAFDDLRRVLDGLSPSPEEPFQPGQPTRVRIEDARDIPTLAMPYGTVPLTHASAGFRRCAGLAYVLVWAWHEHLQAARLLKSERAEQIVLLVDELEAHLHPRWQRSLLPAILDVVSGLTHLATDAVELVVATHSPLVLASIEPKFDEERDRVIHFDLRSSQAHVEEMPWSKQGDVVGWLTSEIFGLKQARSRDAERAINAAQAWMRSDFAGLPEGLRTQDEIHRELLRVIPEHDAFWPRWIIRMEKAS